MVRSSRFASHLGCVLGLGVLAAVPAAEAADAPISLQEAILRVKPATVLIVSEVASEVAVNCSAGTVRVTPSPFRETGSGWFVDPNGWIVTNGHVIQPAHAPPPWVVSDQARRGVVLACVTERLAKDGIGPGQRPDLEEELKQDAFARVLPSARVALKPSIYAIMSNGFRFPAKVIKYSPPVSTEPGAMSGRDLALLQVEASEMPSFALAQSKHVKIGDPIRILGFPGVVLTHELLNSTARVEASVTNGTISSFKQDVQNQPVMQTDAPAAWGNSGGPAINSQGDLIGVLTFVSLASDAVGSLVQGFNFVIPSDAVKEFLRGTPVNLSEPNPFNEHWFLGLRRFFGDDWKGAAEAIKAANRLQPEFPDLQRILAEAEEKIKNPPPRPFPWPLATAAVAAAAVGVGAVTYGLRRRASRSRVSPADVVRLFESGSPPVVLDARPALAYALSPFRIPGSLHVPLEDLPSRMATLQFEPSRTVIAYCTSPEEQASAAVAQQLAKLGQAEVRILRGGLGAWTNAGLPLESKPVSAELGVAGPPSRLD